MKTMNGEMAKPSELLNGIEAELASNEREEKQVLVKLPSTYTQEDLIVNNREIATADKLKKWKYLDKLKPNKSVAEKKN